MNLDKLTAFALSVVLAAALAGNLGRLQLWVAKAQAQLLCEARASAWGSPSIFKNKSKSNYLVRHFHALQFGFSFHRVTPASFMGCHTS